MSEREPLPPIKFEALNDALLDRIDALVPVWLPGGSMKGNEYFVHSHWRSEKTASLSVRMSGHKVGMWQDHGGEHKGGDLISLYAAIYGISNGAAAVRLARELGLESVAGVLPATGQGAAVPQPAPAPALAKPREKAKEPWATVVPVPGNAPAATFKHEYRSVDDIEHLATYQIDGELYGYVVRFRKSDGGKETLPHTWCQSAANSTLAWKWRTWSEPRPLYFPAGLSPAGFAARYETKPTVVLVEGEKKAGILQALLDAGAPGVYLVASWVGGCKAWDKAQWHWLKDSTVLLWPDCDGKREPLTLADKQQHPDEAAQLVVAQAKPLLPAHKQVGMKAMVGIGALLRDALACMVQMLPIPEPGAVDDGWDCADAIEKDGWDFARVLQFFGQAQPFTGDGDKPKAAAGATGGGKKNDGPVDTDAGDFDGYTQIGARRIPNWLACYYDKVNKRWLPSRKLVITVLQHDPVLMDVLAYNELSNNVQSRVAWPWPHGQAGDVTDAVDLLLGNYITETYGLPSISRAALAEAIQTVAHTRRFHPVREMLAGLQWDGKSRIDKWLIHILGETPESLSTAMQEYLQVVGRCWLLGMVNRVMQPGCKFDYCPVLEGVGGLRKSTMVEILAGSPYYSDTPFEVGRGKEAQEQVQGLWVYEIAEMTHFSKAEVGAIKAFISSKVDRYRVAYGSTVGSFARQCVLVGTTNENTYLRDRTGNRRFWPVPVRHIINTEWLSKYRDQLLAEAYALYGPGVPYTPTPEQERRLFVPMQESRLVETAVLSELLHVLTRAPGASGIQAIVNELTDFVTIAQLTLALGVDAAKSSPALEAQIRGWLDHEGWERIKKQINGARAWGYVRPRNWPNLDADDDITATPPPAAGGSMTEEDDDVPF